jgi:hypothetical protein
VRDGSTFLVSDRRGDARGEETGARRTDGLAVEDSGDPHSCNHQPMPPAERQAIHPDRNLAFDRSGLLAHEPATSVSGD